MTDRRVRIGVAAGVLLMAGAAIIAQQPQGRGRGRGEPPPPNPLGQPILDPTGHVKDEAVIHVPLAAADSKYADLDGKKMKAIVRELAAISDKNRDSGEVFPPSRAARKAWAARSPRPSMRWRLPSLRKIRFGRTVARSTITSTAFAFY